MARAKSRAREARLDLAVFHGHPAEDMSSETPKRPRIAAKGGAAQAARQARLAEALRDNLKKRKAQTRARAPGPEATGPGAGKLPRGA